MARRDQRTTGTRPIGQRRHDRSPSARRARRAVANVAAVAVADRSPSARRARRAVANIAAVAVADRSPRARRARRAVANIAAVVVAVRSPSARRARRAVATVVVVAVMAGACGDATGTGDEGGEADRASTTIVQLGPATTTSAPGAGSSSTSAETASAPPVTAPWPGLSFALAPVAVLSQPTAMAVRPGSDQLWFTERSGRVRRVERSGGTDEAFDLAAEPVLDIADRVTMQGEGGLLGIAFSADGGLLYLHYTDIDGDSVIAEFAMNGDEAEAEDERILLRVDQPFSNHNGGDLAFGPDGLLYIGLGDGGSRGDPHLNGQDRSTLLGSILRIDPRPGQGVAYLLPADNPFVGSADGFAPEIWVWGARNPWRFSFDAVTGDLWIADVGQDRFEEIDLLPATADEPAGRGANLGWNLMEGNEPFAGEAPSDHSPPLYAYEQSDDRCSVTGGYVYRGSAIPELEGVYLFGDYCADRLTGLARADDGSITVADLVIDRRVENVIAFGQGTTGELFVLEQGGRISLLQSV